jgi:uncharacterized protein (TIGR03435 family)
MPEVQMDKLELLEAMLSRYTPPDRAASILGDLLETARFKGRLWFWISFTRILCSLAWRVPVAWLGAYAFGVSVIALMMTHDPLWLSADFKNINPSGPISIPALLIVTTPGMALWFVAPYAALRFGLRDRFSQLAGALFTLTTLTLVFGRHSAALVIGASLLVAAVIAALCLRDWRKPVIGLSLAVGTALGGFAGLATLTQIAVDTHPDWSYNRHWLAVRIGLTLSFVILAATCSLMHSLLHRTLRQFVTVAIVSTILSSASFAWAANTDDVFAVADVHPSPFRREPEMRGGKLIGDRYTSRDVPMLNLISAAYGIEPKYIIGGPSWLEWDRFDIFAKATPTASPSDVQDMLRGLLVDRFKLATHTDSKPQPAFILTVGKGKLQLKKGSGDTGCTGKQLDAAVGLVEETCHNITMEVFAQATRQMAGAYVTSGVVDSTGLKGTWDIDIKWTAKAMLAKAGADGITFFDALNKQLGLQLTPGTAPLPVLVVDSVNETPTPNVPDLPKLMPPPPVPEFEVSIIKPSKSDTKMDGDLSGGQMKFQGATLDVLIRAAWDLPDSGPMLQGAPKRLTEDHYDVLAKAPREPGAPELDQDDLRPMLQKLLAERFHLATHSEQQTMDAYNLVAANPKLKKSDPTTRTRCFQGPGADGKDPRIDTPILNRLLTCRNITMAQFAGQIQGLAPGYIKTPVLDATGIEGAYDFTLSYSGAGKLKQSAGSPEQSATGVAADPSGAISFFDALSNELGLKLEKVKRPVPVLVIDHVDEKPTDN